MQMGRSKNPLSMNTLSMWRALGMFSVLHCFGVVVLRRVHSKALQVVQHCLSASSLLIVILVSEELVGC